MTSWWPDGMRRGRRRGRGRRKRRMGELIDFWLIE